MDTTIERVASYASGFRSESLPQDVIHQTKRRIIDTLGCALGGYDAEPCRIARKIATRVKSDSGARVLGTNHRTLPELATFANGVMARYLDGLSVDVDDAPVISIPIAICLFFMMYPIMVKIDFAEVLRAGKNVKPVGLTLFINWAVKPFTMYAISLFFLGTVFIGFIGADAVDLVKMPLGLDLNTGDTHGVGTVVITRGPDGSIAARDRERWRAGAYDVASIDPSGSGDAFDAGIIAGILRGWDMARTLRFAAALGASATTAIGTTDGVFTPEQAEAFLGKHPLNVEHYTVDDRVAGA